MYYVLLVTLVPLTAIIALGFVWVWLKQPLDNATLGRVASDIGMPCLALSTLANAEISVSAFTESAVAALTCLVVLAVLGAVALRLVGLRLRTYLPSVTWGNAGFLGIPIALYAFGPTGLAYAVAFSAISLVFNSIFSQAVAAGRANLVAVQKSPLIYCIAIGLMLQLLGVRLPDWIGRGLSLMGGVAIPLMLMMVGASIARIKAVSIGRALAFSVLRSAGGGSVGMAVGSILGLPPVAQNVLVLQCAMPVAVLSYIFAERWNNEPDEIASLVAVSTWSAAVSVPLMLSLMISRLPA